MEKIEKTFKINSSKIAKKSFEKQKNKIFKKEEMVIWQENKKLTKLMLPKSQIFENENNNVDKFFYTDRYIKKNDLNLSSSKIDLEFSKKKNQEKKKNKFQISFSPLKLSKSEKPENLLEKDEFHLSINQKNFKNDINSILEKNKKCKNELKNENINNNIFKNEKINENEFIQNEKKDINQNIKKIENFIKNQKIIKNTKIENKIFQNKISEKNLTENFSSNFSQKNTLKNNSEIISINNSQILENNFKKINFEYLSKNNLQEDKSINLKVFSQKNFQKNRKKDFNKDKNLDLKDKKNLKNLKLNLEKIVIRKIENNKKNIENDSKKHLKKENKINLQKENTKKIKIIKKTNLEILKIKKFKNPQKTQNLKISENLKILKSDKFINSTIKIAVDNLIVNFINDDLWNTLILLAIKQQKDTEEDEGVLGIRTNINAINEYCNLLINFVFKNFKNEICDKFNFFKNENYGRKDFCFDVLENNEEFKKKNMNLVENNKIDFILNLKDIEKNKDINFKKEEIENNFKKNKGNLKKDKNDEIKVYLKNTKKDNILSLKIYIDLEKDILKNYENMNIEEQLFEMQKIYHRSIFDTFNEIITKLFQKKKNSFFQKNNLSEKIIKFPNQNKNKNPSIKTIQSPKNVQIPFSKNIKFQSPKNIQIFQLFEIKDFFLQTKEIVVNYGMVLCGIMNDKEDSLMSDSFKKFDQFSIDLIREERLFKQIIFDFKENRNNFFNNVEKKSRNVAIFDVCKIVEHILFEDLTIFLKEFF